MSLFFLSSLTGLEKEMLQKENNCSFHQTAQSSVSLSTCSCLAVTTPVMRLKRKVKTSNKAIPWKLRLGPLRAHDSSSVPTDEYFGHLLIIRY